MYTHIHIAVIYTCGTSYAFLSPYVMILMLTNGDANDDADGKRTANASAHRPPGEGGGSWDACFCCGSTDHEKRDATRGSNTQVTGIYTYHLQITLAVPNSLFARHLLVSVLVLCLEGLCIGNTELAAPSPKKT